MTNDPKTLWQSQPVAPFTLDAHALQREATRLTRRVRWRNALEYGAGACVMAVFAHYIHQFTGPLMRSGSVLVMLATVFVLHQLHRRSGMRPTPAARWGDTSLAFLRAELIRQQRALREAWLWYVLPFVPGVAVFRWGVETELGAGSPFAQGVLANAVIAAVFIAIALANRWQAHRVQRHIDHLARLATDSGAPPPENQP